MHRKKHNSILYTIIQLFNIAFIGVIFLVAYLRIEGPYLILLLLFNIILLIISYFKSELDLLQTKIFGTVIILVSSQLIIILLQSLLGESPNLLTYLLVMLSFFNFTILFSVKWKSVLTVRIFAVIISIFGYLMVDDISFYTNSVSAIVSSIIFMLLIISTIENKYFKFLWLFVVLFFVIKLFELYSRTTIIALLIIIAFELLFRLFRIKNIKSYIKLIAITILSSIPIYTYLYLFIYNNQLSFDNLFKIFNILFPGKEFFTGREIIWQNVINLLNGNMIFGIGEDKFNTNILYGYGHNLYISSLIHQGLFGTILYFAMIYFIIVTILRSSEKINIVLRIGIYSLIAMLIIQLSEGYFMDPYISAILLMPLSLSISLSNKKYRYNTLI